MAVNAKRVLIGTPDQATTGAVAYAEIGATLPTSAVDAVTGFTDAGYVSEDGLSLSLEYSDTDLLDWSKSSIRTLLDEFTGEITLTFVQTSEAELKMIFGEDNVTVTSANSSHGNQLAVKVGARMAPPRSYVFRMKDGDERILLVAPNAQAILDGEISFTASDAISWPARIKCNKDSAGENLYIYTDDGASA